MSLLIGMSHKSFTPQGPISLRGQFHTRISKYVESEIEANVLVCSNGADKMILCACDLVDIGDEFYKLLCDELDSRCPEIGSQNVIFSATHIHTGPFSYCEGSMELHIGAKYLPKGKTFVDNEVLSAEVWQGKKVTDCLTSNICDAVIEAWNNRKEGRYAQSFGRAVIGHCRRTAYIDGSAKMYGNTNTVTFDSLEGGNDSGIELLYLFDGENKPIGAVANIACPSQVVEGECYVSSDYWGKARDILREKYGESFVLVGLCAPAGDQSPRDLIRRGKKFPYDSNIMYSLPGAVELGKRVANVLLENIDEASNRTLDDSFIDNRHIEYELPIRRVTPSEYEAAKAEYYSIVASMNKDVFTPFDMSQLHVSAGTMERFEYQEGANFYKTYLNIIRFNNMVFASNPFELFLNYGNQIKARCQDYQLFLIQLANGSGGYLPTEKAEHGSHYSAYVSSGIVGHEGGKLYVEKTIDVINNM